MLMKTIIFILASSCAAAESFQLPLKCHLGHTCFVETHQEVAEKKDVPCGVSPLLKFRISAFQRKASPFSLIYPAATGTISSLETNHPDFLSQKINGQGKPACGNRVVIDHGHGWQTTYCHLRKDSSDHLKIGQKVTLDHAIGAIGLSGDTTFPHLGFFITKNKLFVNPHYGIQTNPQKCNRTAAPLWDQKTQEQLKKSHDPQLISMGVADIEPDLPSLILNTSALTSSPNPEALYVYALLGNSSPKDRVIITVQDQEGQLLAHNITPSFGGMSVAQRLHNFRIARPGQAWPVGSVHFNYTYLAFDGKRHKPLFSRILTINFQESNRTAI